MKQKIYLLFLLATSFIGFARADTFDHSEYNRLLQKYVTADGLVNYNALKNNPTQLDNYLKQLEQVKPDEFNNWPQNEQLAFWINAYNAITIKGILKNYPIKYGDLIARARFPQNSIRQIKDFWDTVFIRIMGEDITLNRIEHEILRKQFKEPRIHFAIVCASIGCPKLQNRAYFPDDIDKSLEKAATEFLANPQKVWLDKQKNTLYLSAIFNWFKKDFQSFKNPKLLKYDSDIRGVIAFVINHFSETDKEYVIQKHPRIKFMDYDWTLNNL